MGILVFLFGESSGTVTYEYEKRSSGIVLCGFFTVPEPEPPPDPEPEPEPEPEPVIKTDWIIDQKVPYSN